MKTVSVKFSPAASVDYKIYIENGLLANFAETAAFQKKFSRVKKFAIITDTNVHAHYAPPVTATLENAGFGVIVKSFPHGEKSKNIETFAALQNWLAENEITRSDAIVALGGGVVGDLTGFVAATYLRGVDFLQIPTSLLAMVDSSVGGKTAIDIPAGKNLVGAFYQPKMVVCDPETLKTLPAENFADGCAEAVKHGMIRSEKLLHAMEKNFDAAEIIEENVKIKRDVVQRDEFDTGERQLLNFGHTVGHAIEKLSSFDISHGNSVAIGMAIITRAAVKKNFCAYATLDVLQKLLQKYNLPTRTDFSASEIFGACLTDKKRTGGTITEVVPRAPGVCELQKMPLNELLDWIQTGMED